ncbi:MAG: response regulator [Verrucomicrobiota bacterium]
MKILAIDDNPDNLIALQAVVSDRLPGTRVLTALNGPQGLEIALAEDPDVILLDIVMPGMDGYAVCRKLKEDEHLQMIPVLFLTALKTDRASRVQALEVGAEGFLSKPFDEIELSAQIRAMAKIKAAVLIQRNDQERLTNLVAQRTRALQESQDSMLNLLEDLHAENEARKHGEQAMESQLEELRRWHAATLGREGRIGALKREVNELAALLNQPLPYATPEDLERSANL